MTQYTLIFSDGKVLVAAMSEASKAIFSVPREDRVEVRTPAGEVLYLPAGMAGLARQPDKTTGLGGFIRAMTGGMVEEREREHRLEVCAGCDAVDLTGARMYRKIGTRHYCGAPKADKIVRDEKLEGCGCNLEFKTRFAKTLCPLGKW